MVEDAYSDSHLPILPFATTRQERAMRRIAVYVSRHGRLTGILIRLGLVGYLITLYVLVTASMSWPRLLQPFVLVICFVLTVAYAASVVIVDHAWSVINETNDKAYELNHAYEQSANCLLSGDDRDGMASLMEDYKGLATASDEYLAGLIDEW